MAFPHARASSGAAGSYSGEMKYNGEKVLGVFV